MTFFTILAANIGENKQRNNNIIKKVVIINGWSWYSWYKEHWINANKNVWR